MRVQSLFSDGKMPLLVQPGDREQASAEGLASWSAEHRHDLDEWLHRDGAVLFRGFGIGDAEEFRGVAVAVCPRLVNYVGGDSPRRNVANQVYTSTEFSPHLEIGLHNELSYTRSWPERVFFCSLQVAENGGETHIADGRRVLEGLDPEVRERFVEKRVLYTQHLRDRDEPGPGKSWQETFETTSRDEVERICANQDMEFQWTGRGLKTTLHNPGVLTHPITREVCWFNQAVLWHAGFVGAKAQESRLAGTSPGKEAFGCHARYGDGSEIPMSDLRSVHSACEKSEILFSWQAGDLLILDNILAMHGRKPFTGERRVLVAMG
jgi:alpha-ketoglutarate-dependent taurine dioxygenase